MKNEFSPVYLDDVPITLMGNEARPRLSRIVQAGGKRPDDVVVRWLMSSSDPTGRVLDPQEIIDRTVEPTQAIYLWSVSRPGRDPTAGSTAAEGVAPGVAPTAEQADRVIASPGMTPRPVRADPRFYPEPPLRQTQAMDPIAEASVRVRLFRGARGAEEQALAEAEAQERQEEQREGEGIDQDEQEALDEADEDYGSMD